jgi:hypothetical protein
VRWLAERGGEVVVEFVDRDDPMAATLLARKAPGSNPDYERAHFERCLEEHFEIARRADVPPGTRTLYHGVPRAGAAATA